MYIYGRQYMKQLSTSKVINPHFANISVDYAI